MAVPASGFHPDDFARDPRPRRQLAQLDYHALHIGKIPSEVSAVFVVPTARNPSKKRKAETATDAGPRKSAKSAAKGAAVAMVPKTSATERKVRAKKPGTALAKRPIKMKERQKPSASFSTHVDQTTTVISIPSEDRDLVGVQDNHLGESDSDDDLSSEPGEEEMAKLEQEYVNERRSISQPDQEHTSLKTPTSTLPARKASKNLAMPGFEGKTKDADPSKMLVILKIHTAWFTKEGKLRARILPEISTTPTSSKTPKFSALKTSKALPRNPLETPKSAAKVQKAPGTPAAPVISTTPRAPTARKPAHANVPLTLVAEEEELNQGALDQETLIDPGQLRLSKKLTHRESIPSKPTPSGSPKVWAESRQALCETVPYFKMPQSGCHQNDGHVYAFLYDGAFRCREYMDTDLIISGAGGGMESDSTGQLVQKKNHTMDEAQVKAVLNDIEHKNPLVVICGNKSEGALCKMPHRYNVLDWFKPTAVWAEKTMGKKNKTWTTIRYRFERLNQAEAAWHKPNAIDSDSALSEDERQSIPPLMRQNCQSCSTTHAMVYLNGWMCLSPDCAQFWKLPSGKDAPYGDMHFNPAFLLERTDWAVEIEPFSVKPPVLSVGSTVGDNLTHINTRGMCCPNCGRCNSRRFFKGWKCENVACAFENFPTHIPVQIPLLHQPWETTGDGPALARNKHDRAQGVEMSVDFKLGFKVYRYSVPGVNGALIHLVSNTTINKLLGGADDMFDAMQREDLHLERRRFGVEKMSSCKGQAKSQEEPTILSAEPEQVVPHTVHPPETSKDVETSAASHLESESMLSMNSNAAAQQNQPPNLPSESRSKDERLVPASAPAQKPDQEAKKQEIVEDGDFMTAFSMNYGMPYKFVANGASLAFRDSPWPVRAARADLNWASQTFLDPEGHEDLNEELIFAYMEGQKLEYHDDGEEGLGPRIATLSLGGKAKMHLRMKMKHYTGCSKTGLLTKGRPVPGSIAGTVDGVELTSQEMYEKRLAAWEELQQLTDRKAYNKRAKEIPLELGLFEKRTKKADDLVTVTLNHGDIVLMEGYEIQKYLEHKVVPEQCLRFALTCRTILPDHLKPEERPPYGVEPDEERMSALRRMVSTADGKSPRLELKEN